MGKETGAGAASNPYAWVGLVVKTEMAVRERERGEREFHSFRVHI